jgi:hypothetical protein
MECPFCGAELDYNDYYGWGIPSREDFRKIGYIYRCPNFEGFETNEEALEYAKNIPENERVSVEEITCDSADFNGLFYTDEHDELHEGYPC